MKHKSGERWLTDPRGGRSAFFPHTFWSSYEHLLIVIKVKILVLVERSCVVFPRFMFTGKSRVVDLF